MPRGKAQPVEERFWSYVNKDGRESDEMTKCWEWTGWCDKDGYGKISINRRTFRGAHRFSFTLNNSYGLSLEDIEGCDICHACDNPRCVNPEHLFVGSRQDNIDDREIKGRGIQGNKCHKAKLNETQVLEIRNRYAQGNITQEQLAFEYGVAPSTIERLINHKSWKHLTTPSSYTHTFA